MKSNEKTRVTRNNIAAIIRFYFDNGFREKWTNNYYVKMDRIKNNKLEVIYIPTNYLNYKQYVTSEIHIINK